jgi:hypothetical protein
VLRIRFFEKKRGEHHTMSEASGRLAIAVLFGVLAAAGAAILAVVLGSMTIAEWRANHEFVESRCTILGERVAQVETNGRIKYRPEFTIRYSASGSERETTAFDPSRMFLTDEDECRRVLDEFSVGQEYPCWYDPQDPATAVIRRGYSWYAWLLPLLPASFIAVGAGGLIYLFFTWGKSAEHRTSLQQANLELFDQSRQAVERFPTVPIEVGMTSSAGTTLRYRVPYIPMISSFLLTTLAVVWNGAMLWFISDTAIAVVRGSGFDWKTGITLLPFLAAGGYLAYLAGRGLLVSLGVEPTVVEISDYPVFPGGKYEVYVSQGGRHFIKRFTVVLVCDEEATFRQGTNSRTHTHRTAEIEIFRREGIAAEGGVPFAARFEFRMPDGAMHSFQTTHNAVKWRLLVRAQLQKWPDFEREFTLVVGPPGSGGSR